MTALSELYPLLPGPLPIRVKPFHDETPASFLRRLRMANEIDGKTFNSLLMNSPFQEGALAAALSGIPQERLGLAIPRWHPDPELPFLLTRPKSLPSRACLRCVRRRAGDVLVEVFMPGGRPFCPRHLRWVDDFNFQYDLRGLPAFRPTDHPRHGSVQDVHLAASAVP